MRFAWLCLAILACGSDQFSGPDAAKDALSDGPQTDGGGDGNNNGKPKARLLVTVIDANLPAPGALLAWEDPDAINTPRQADVSIALSSPADVIATKTRRVFVGAIGNLFMWDDASMLTSQSAPQTIGKNAFINMPPLSIQSLAYDSVTDALAVVEAAGAQLLKGASVLTAQNATASARFGTEMDQMSYVAMDGQGGLFAATSSYSKSFGWSSVLGATGTVPAGNWGLGAGRIVATPGKLWVPTIDFGTPVAVVYVYTTPLSTQMQGVAFQIRDAFGPIGTTDAALGVAIGPNILATAVLLHRAMPSDPPKCAICVMQNPANVGGMTPCDHMIPFPMDSFITRIFERKGTLYVGVSPVAGDARLDVFRSPMSDTKPTISFNLPNRRGVSGIAIAEAP